jgi:fatty acid desaturase
MAVTAAEDPGAASTTPSISTAEAEILHPQASSSSSPAAMWHRRRRKLMMGEYREQIAPLERASSLPIGLPLLVFVNGALTVMACQSATWSLGQIVALAAFPGSVLSLWQLQILHDVLHGCFRLPTKWEDRLLRLGSIPSVFGYYLYLKFGHLTHHKSLGSGDASNLKALFDSSRVDFEDGDVLFVAHRMEIGPEIGPTFRLPGGRSLTFSLSRSAFQLWRPDNPVWNGLVFAASFLLERFMLCVNDVVVAITGVNSFFPNKPEAFHRECANQARMSTGFRLALAGCAEAAASGAWWKPLFFLFLCETLWSVPPHPCSAMFLTNHPSAEANGGGGAGSPSSCIPSQSTYAGGWYSVLTLGTNYHAEHHDFPTVPFHLLHRLPQVAPEFYRTTSIGGSTSTRSRQERDNVWTLMRNALSRPSVYACLNHDISSPAPQNTDGR